MRLLWIKMGGLWPATSGGRIRSLLTLSHLSARHDVTVVTTHGPQDDPAGLVRRLPDCRHVVSFPFAPPKSGSPAFVRALVGSWLSDYPVDLWKWRLPELREQVRELLAEEQFDLCVADFLVAAAHLSQATPVPVVLFEHNVEYLIWQRLAALERRLVRRTLLDIEWRKLRRCEAAACAAADLTIAVAETDRRTLTAIAPTARIASVPTGVDTTYFVPGGAREIPHRLVFTGSMDWYPNYDAVLYFCDAILPRIRAQIPDVSFSVVGRNPGTHLASLARLGVTVTGTVPDVRPHIDEAALYIVPLRAGGGTRLKIFEAFAMAKAVVSTTIGAEGLGVTPNRDIVLADDPETFARAVVSLLQDSPARQRLGRAGRALVESSYTWRHAAEAFEAHCEAILAEKAQNPGPRASGLHQGMHT
jgi:glycosyltransferase involved in cell wall biosynthesis